MAEMMTQNTRSQNPILAQSKHGKSLHCLLIPVQEKKLLLPNTAVAEVITYVNPEPIDNSPDWLLGKITWRDVSVPLVSFDILSGISDVPGSSRRIAVLNTLNGNPGLPYVAMLINGIPQLRLIKEDNILDDDTIESELQVVVRTVKLNDEPALIPDLDDLESRLLPLL